MLVTLVTSTEKPLPLGRSSSQLNKENKKYLPYMNDYPYLMIHDINKWKKVIWVLK